MTPATATLAAAVDPTGTTGIRAQYERDMVRRWTALRDQVHAAVIEFDAFDLTAGDETTVLTFLNRRQTAPAVAQDGAAEDILAEYGLSPFTVRPDIFQRLPPDLRQRVPIRRFAFPLDEEKLDGFSEWLAEAMDAMILEVVRGPGGRISYRSGWQDLYVRAAYARGVDTANERLAEAGMADVTVPELGTPDDVVVPREILADVFNRPLHVQALGALYSRNFTELQGVTQATAQQMSRVLAEGLGQGLGPEKISTLLAGRIDAIGIRRARLIARTEIIRAFADATLLRYQEAGIREVVGAVELLTARDDRVCPICRFLEEQGPVSIEEAKGVIPVHPNCRCAWIPVIDN